MAFLYVLLVLIWSTGFITGKLIVGLIDPNVFLSIRFVLAGLLFLGIALWQRRRFPAWNDLPKHIIAGMLMNGFYLGFAYVAIRPTGWRYGLNWRITASLSGATCLLVDQRENVSERRHRHACWHHWVSVGYQSSTRVRYEPWWRHFADIYLGFCGDIYSFSWCDLSENVDIIV